MKRFIRAKYDFPTPLNRFIKIFVVFSSIYPNILKISYQLFWAGKMKKKALHCLGFQV